MVKFFLLFSTLIFAREIPILSGPVVDESKVLSSETKDSLSSFLMSYHQQTSNQIQVLIIDSLEGDSLEEFSIRVADKWQLGDKEKDNGILFLVSLRDRKMRLEVGQGLEGDLPDVLAGRIIDHVKPYFRIGKYDQGISTGISLITKTLKGEKIPAKRAKLPFVQIFIALLILIWFIFSRILVPGGRRWEGYSSSGGLRGGWGGGGGGFSGGGASGNW